MRKIKLVILLLIVFGGNYLIYKNMGGKLLLRQKSIIEEQRAKELDFEFKEFKEAEVILDPYNVSPLTAIIPLRVNEKSSIHIFVDGKYDDTSLSYSYELEKGDHLVPIYGLYPSMVNRVHVAMKEVTKRFNIMTGDVNSKVSKVVDIKSDVKKLDDSFYFVTPSSDTFLSGYDKRGDLRFYFSKKFSWDLKRLKNGNILVSSDRFYEAPYHTTGLLEMDFSGKVYKEYNLEGGYHHDAFEMSNGNLLVLTSDFKRKTSEDLVVELDRETGKVVKTIDIQKILPKNEGKNLSATDDDWFHNNSVYYDEKTNLVYLSGRHVDLVVVIDYKTSELKYLIGPMEGYTKEYQKYFLKPINNTAMQWAQHAAEITPEGYLFLFDNGLYRSKTESNKITASNNYSRGIIYKMDFNNKTIEEVYSYGKERKSSFYSPYISDVDYLKKDNYLIHSGGIGTLNGVSLDTPAGLTNGAKLRSTTVEINNNQKVFELTLDKHFYRAEKMQIYKGSNTLYKTGKSLGTLGKTPLSKSKVHNFQLVGKVPEKYNLKLTKESDRLKIEGDFTKGDKILVVLESFFGKKVYETYASRLPYTAMCLDIHNKEVKDNNKVHVKTFINEEGLSGFYKIFIVLDKNLYETGYSVNFN